MIKMVILETALGQILLINLDSIEAIYQQGKDSRFWTVLLRCQITYKIHDTEYKKLMDKINEVTV